MLQPCFPVNNEVQAMFTLRCLPELLNKNAEFNGEFNGEQENKSIVRVQMG